jgi:hypothetical protein
LKLEEIAKMWEKDSEIDELTLSQASASTPKLHHKYMTQYTQEWLTLKKRRAEHKRLILIKKEYYTGEMSQEDLEERGWKPYKKMILKSDLPQYIESDIDVIESALKVGVCEAKVEYLESVLKEIGRRSFHIKNIIDWEKFRMGVT